MHIRCVSSILTDYLTFCMLVLCSPGAWCKRTKWIWVQLTVPFTSNAWGTHFSSSVHLFLTNICFTLFLTTVMTCAQVSHKSTQRQVNITVRKQQRGWWNRLTVQERRPVFLAPDFDRWLDESDAEMEIREKVRRNNFLSSYNLCFFADLLAAVLHNTRDLTLQNATVWS